MITKASFNRVPYTRKKCDGLIAIINRREHNKRQGRIKFYLIRRKNGDGREFQ
jgi:hypothetical protein